MSSFKWIRQVLLVTLGLKDSYVYTLYVSRILWNLSESPCLFIYNVWQFWVSLGQHLSILKYYCQSKFLSFFLVVASSFLCFQRTSCMGYPLTCSYSVNLDYFPPWELWLNSGFPLIQMRISTPTDYIVTPSDGLGCSANISHNYV